MRVTGFLSWRQRVLWAKETRERMMGDWQMAWLKNESPAQCPNSIWPLPSVRTGCHTTAGNVWGRNSDRVRRNTRSRRLGWSAIGRRSHVNVTRFCRAALLNALECSSGHFQRLGSSSISFTAGALQPGENLSWHLRAPETGQDTRNNIQTKDRQSVECYYRFPTVSKHMRTISDSGLCIPRAPTTQTASRKVIPRFSGMPTLEVT